MTTYIVDIDDTICKTGDIDYRLAEPKYDIINIFNKLYDEGHTIIYETARGSVTKINWRETTERQLAEWEVEYDELRFVVRPRDYLLVNDKACNIKNIHQFIRDKDE